LWEIRLLNAIIVKHAQVLKKDVKRIYVAKFVALMGENWFWRSMLIRDRKIYTEIQWLAKL